jgi:hypothetical protein
MGSPSQQCPHLRQSLGLELGLQIYLLGEMKRPMAKTINLDPISWNKVSTNHQHSRERYLFLQASSPIQVITSHATYFVDFSYKVNFLGCM